MALFSERYGYTKPSDVIIREQITPEIQNAICSCYDNLRMRIGNMYILMEKVVWTFFLNERSAYFQNTFRVVTNYIEKADAKWYSKLDLIEFSISTLYDYNSRNQRYGNDYTNEINSFINNLNDEFKRLNFAYRITNNQIAEITSEEEIVTIEEALNTNKDNIRTHLNKALEFYAQKPIGEYRNSIKESISAVEAISRDITGDNVLNFKKMEEKGLVIPSVLRQAFEKLYGYTNDKTTGIRHALMDNEGTYVPQAEEALFMLVSCSTFINYLNKKVK